jgi:hypothetical protein
LDRWSVVELLQIRRNELLISRIRKGGVPERATVDKLGDFAELLVIVGKQPIRHCAHHGDVNVQLFQLAGDGKKILKTD